MINQKVLLHRRDNFAALLQQLFARHAAKHLQSLLQLNCHMTPACYGLSLLRGICLLILKNLVAQNGLDWTILASLELKAYRGAANAGCSRLV